MILDIGTKEGKTFHIELEKEKENLFFGKKIGEVLEGSLLDPKFRDFKFQITGLSNIAGFPARRDLDGIALKKLLLTRSVGMRTTKPKGLRLRKTIRGNTLARDIVQINVKVMEGDGKKLAALLGKREKIEVEVSESAEK